MSQHKVLARSIRLATGEDVDLKYWGGGTSIYVAGFIGDKQVTAARYSAEVDIAEDFDAMFRQPLIDGLCSTAESDLCTNPGLHFRP